MTKPDGADSVDRLEYLLNKYELMENGLPAFGDLRTTKDRFRDELRQWISDGIGEDEPEIDNGYMGLVTETMIETEARNHLRQEIRQRLGL